MKIAPITYHRPSQLREAIDILRGKDGDAKIIAGGQSLIPLLAMRLSTATDLVDLSRIDELGGIHITDEYLAVRANVTQSQLLDNIEAAIRFPLLNEALSNVAHVQIRNRGTVCGSLAHADSAAELPTAAVALEATMRIASATGVRELPAAEFFQFHLTTALESDEILTEVRFPMPPPNAVGTYEEITHRKGDFALVGLACVVTFDDADLVESCRLVFSGVGPVPQRATRAEEVLVGRALGPAAVSAAEYATRRDIEGVADIHADAAYRRHVAGTLTRHALERIRARAQR